MCALVDQKETYGLCILSVHLTGGPSCVLFHCGSSAGFVCSGLWRLGCEWVENSPVPGPHVPPPQSPLAFSQAPGDKSAIPPNVQATADHRPSPKGAFAAKRRLGWCQGLRLAQGGIRGPKGCASEYFWAQRQGSWSPLCSQWPCTLQSTWLVLEPCVPPRLPRRSSREQDPSCPAWHPSRPRAGGQVGAQPTQGGRPGVWERSHCSPPTVVSEPGEGLCGGGRRWEDASDGGGPGEAGSLLWPGAASASPGGPRGSQPSRAVVQPQELLHGGTTEQSGHSPSLLGVPIRACEVLLWDGQAEGLLGCWDPEAEHGGRPHGRRRSPSVPESPWWKREEFLKSTSDPLWTPTVSLWGVISCFPFKINQR